MISVDDRQCRDPVILNITAKLEQYVARVHEEYNKDTVNFTKDITRQDAATMNIVRAVAAALNIGEHLIRKNRLSVPKNQLDVIDLIATEGFVTVEVADNLKKMIVFRNTALHQPMDLKPTDLEYFILQQLRIFPILKK